jgi:hypothetical protein
MKAKSKLQKLVEEMMRKVREERNGRPMADVFDLDSDSAEWALSTSLGNRNHRPKHVSRLRVAMSSPELWNYDGDACSFATDETGAPRLFEGHHRCEARTLSKVDFNPLITVTVGSSPLAQETRGDKQKWTPRDYSTARGLPPRCGEIASALIRATVKHSGEVKGHHIEAVADVCEHGLRLLGELANAHARLAHSNILAGILIAWPSDPVRVEEFAQLYFSGQFGKEHPVGLLRQWAIENSRRAGLGGHHRVRMAYRATSAVSLFLKGESRKQLKVDGEVVARMLDEWTDLAVLLGVDSLDPVEYLREHREGANE